MRDVIGWPQECTEVALAKCCLSQLELRAKINKNTHTKKVAIAQLKPLKTAKTNKAKAETKNKLATNEN